MQSSNRTKLAKGVTLALASTALCSGLASASAEVSYHQADVVDVQPVYETVTYSVPAEVCRQEEVAYAEPRRRSATGPILGAVIGGAIGHAVGHRKRNKQVGTAVGAVLGGSIGADISRRGGSERVRYETREICETRREERSEERPAGYRVTYAYGGNTFDTHMDRHPGDRIRVRVAISPAGH